MRSAIAFTLASILGCASVHQTGKVVLERDELKGTETEHMTGLFLLESEETRIYMDASYPKPRRAGPPNSVHVWFTVVTPWGFEKDLDPTWVVYTDAFRRDWGDLNRDESGVSLSVGGRYRELFSIDVQPLALETIASAKSVTFRFGTLDVPLGPNDIMTIRKLVSTWKPPSEPGRTDPVSTPADSPETTDEPPAPGPKAPPLVAPPSDIKI